MFRNFFILVLIANLSSGIEGKWQEELISRMLEHPENCTFYTGAENLFLTIFFKMLSFEESLRFSPETICKIWNHLIFSCNQLQLATNILNFQRNKAEPYMYLNQLLRYSNLKSPQIFMIFKGSWSRLIKLFNILTSITSWIY